MSTDTYTVLRGDNAGTRSGCPFATTNDKGMALRLAARIGGFVTTAIFGQTVRVEG